METGQAPAVDDWKTEAADDWQTVSGDDVKIKDHPKATQADIARRYKELTGKEMATMSAGPPSKAPKSSREIEFGPGVKGYVEQARQRAAKFLTDAAPAVGGVVGGLLGSALGPEGTVAGAVVGSGSAGVGGYLGAKASGSPNPKTEGEKQAGYELGGRAIAPIVARAVTPLAAKVAPAVAEYAERYPILKELLPKAGKTSDKAVQHLTAAAAEKGSAADAHEAIGGTIEDIEKTIHANPGTPRTVQGFLDTVNRAKDAMNAESKAAMAPLMEKPVMPTGIADRIRSLITPNMEKTEVGRAEARSILKAAKEFDKPWTYGELDAERMSVRSRLNTLKQMGEVAQYTAKKASRSKAIDDAIERGLRDQIYPTMDQAAGKPEGYFANLKGRQSDLITLQSILDKRVSDLGGKQAVSEVTSPFGSENISLSAHVGSVRAGAYGLKNVFSPTRELNAAGKHVAKAFPPAKVSSLPYQVLLTNIPRAKAIAHAMSSSDQK